MSKHFLIAVFCLISNTVYPMAGTNPSNDEEPDLSSYQHIHLTDENKNKLQTFLKKQLVQFPKDAEICMEAFVLDKGHRDQELGQRYIVKVTATWLSYTSVYREPGIYGLTPEQHGCNTYSYIFDSGLAAANVKL